MRITTFSNNRLFGQGGQARKNTNSASRGNIVADMAQTLHDKAQSGLQRTAQAQAAVSRQDRVELSVKEPVQTAIQETAQDRAKSMAEYAAEIFKTLVGEDGKLPSKQDLEAQAGQSMHNLFQEEAENAREQAEAIKETMEYLLKMLEIARRISSGGRVPGSDEQKLMEFSLELYTVAKNLAIQAKEHKEYDSLFEDEEEQAEDGGAEEVGGATPVAAVEAGGDVAVAEGGEAAPAEAVPVE